MKQPPIVTSTQKTHRPRYATTPILCETLPPKHPQNDPSILVYLKKRCIWFSERKGKERKRKEGKGREGKERKGKERKRKEGKGRGGKERKRKDRQSNPIAYKLG